MKKSEYKQALGKLGYLVTEKSDKEIEVYSYASRTINNQPIIYVGNNRIGEYGFCYNGLNIRDKKLKEAFKTTIDYAFTPLSEREDEPKQYAIHLFSGYYGYLNYDKSKGVLTTTIADVWNEAYKCLFTKEEYNEFREAEMEAGFTTLPEFNPDNRNVFVPMNNKGEM